MDSLQKGKFYRVDYGSGHEDNFIMGKFISADACHYYWEKPYFKKWREYESLSQGGYSVLSCRDIRLATDAEIAVYEKLKAINS